jgi:ABC-2 type transport system ATP-binding protein
MQQKLQFIGTILHEPEIVILDEPFSGLDPINQRVLRDIVGELRREGRTILFSTHIIEHAERICDHVCIIARGARVVDGTVAQVKREHGERYVALAVDPGQDALPVLNASPLVHEIHDDGGGSGRLGGPHLVRLHDGADANVLLEELVRARVRLRRFELVEPSLEQIFIDRVGQPDAAAADLEAALHG